MVIGALVANQMLDVNLILDDGKNNNALGVLGFDIFGERKLKRTKDFRHFSDRARDLIAEKGIMPDVILMEELNFTPPSWKVWRSQLIQKFSLMKYDCVTESGKQSQYKIKYVKKSKTWYTIFDD